VRSRGGAIETQRQAAVRRRRSEGAAHRLQRVARVHERSEGTCGSWRQPRNQSRNNTQPDARRPMPDARCPTPDARRPMPDARCPIPNPVTADQKIYLPRYQYFTGPWRQNLTRGHVMINSEEMTPVRAPRIGVFASGRPLKSARFRPLGPPWTDRCHGGPRGGIMEIHISLVISTDRGRS
jgi:hypothetical protein